MTEIPAAKPQTSAEIRELREFNPGRISDRDRAHSIGLVVDGELHDGEKGGGDRLDGRIGHIEDTINKHREVFGRDISPAEIRDKVAAIDFFEERLAQMEDDLKYLMPLCEWVANQDKKRGASGNYSFFDGIPEELYASAEPYVILAILKRVDAMGDYLRKYFALGDKADNYAPTVGVRDQDNAGFEKRLRDSSINDGREEHGSMNIIIEARSELANQLRNYKIVYEDWLEDQARSNLL